MATLQTPQDTIEILQKYNFSIRKKFGQNFLIDMHVLDKIIDAADISPDDFVLEIGPGLGAMTQRLCEKARQVYAVEIDKMLIPVLGETLAGYDNYILVNEDVLKLDLNEIVKKHNQGRPIKVVANLPYYVTTPIIMSLFEEKIPLKSITVMVQSEVAHRMQAKEGTKDYGALSLAVAYYADPYIAANVPRNCFIPRPNVDSAVITLTCHEDKPVKVSDEKLMFKLIRAAFNQRRKTLVNAVANFEELNYTKDEVAAALTSLGLDVNVRGEALSLKEFAGLAGALTI
ncbi:MAG: 16S rRNA (adenine(1518)-N(6)/adenine(1519)-N(6))-dimethyltransferase RsmA [Lachnospiraceae bacterium]|nr:16S rRNA (adenine(1518)-N(6)/adenine(1519)-N(6))-dimethyltransferase RsmA [Lachnospiraceae bacterium]